jgi:hypothetical protein
MDELEPLISMGELKWKRLTRVKGQRLPHSLRYDSELDTLILLLVQPENPTIVYFVDDNVGLVYEDETLEIVGLQIEDFVREFVPQHEGVERAWGLTQSSHEVKDYGELSVTFHKSTPIVAREVVRATSDILRPQDKDLAEALIAA